jgi:hypothetical protein
MSKQRQHVETAAACRNSGSTLKQRQHSETATAR